MNLIPSLISAQLSPANSITNATTASPPPQAAPAPAPAYAPAPNMAFGQQQMYMQAGGIPVHQYYANPQFWPRHFPQQGQGGMGMPMNGYQGYPGMFQQPPQMQQWQQMPPNGQMGAGNNPPRIHRVHINLRLLFSIVVIAIAVITQGSSPNWYFILTALITYAFLNGWIPGFGGRRQAHPNPQNPAQANGGQVQPDQRAQRPADGPQNQNPQNPQNPAYDRLDRDPPPADGLNIPAVLRYDWRHHTGLTGEVLGFVCPLFFSLWPSWDPSILGDHPDVIRRRQEEAESQRLQEQARAGQDNAAAQPPQPIN